MQTPAWVLIGAVAEQIMKLHELIEITIVDRLTGGFSEAYLSREHMALKVETR